MIKKLIKRLTLDLNKVEALKLNLVCLNFSNKALQKENDLLRKRLEAYRVQYGKLKLKIQAVDKTESVADETDDLPF